MEVLQHVTGGGLVGGAGGGAVSRMWVSIAELAALLEPDAAHARRCFDLWFTPRERATLDGLTVPKRRREWLAGRVAAKELVRRRHRLAGEDAFRRIEIVTSREGPQRGKPSYRIGDAPGPFDLSISHSRTRAVAALAATAHERIGIDIEQIETRDRSFEALALSDTERALIARLEGDIRAVAVTQRWVLKEALSKALGTGLRLPFERVTIHIGDGARAHTPSVRFETPLVHELPFPGEISARLGRIGGICVASVALRPAAAAS
jgi:phosphopantetheinyl transferase